MGLDIPLASDIDVISWFVGILGAKIYKNHLTACPRPTDPPTPVWGEQKPTQGEPHVC